MMTPNPRLVISGFVCPVCGVGGTFDIASHVAPGDHLVCECPNGHKTTWSVAIVAAKARVIA